MKWLEPKTTSVRVANIKEEVQGKTCGLYQNPETKPRISLLIMTSLKVFECRRGSWLLLFFRALCM